MGKNIAGVFQRERSGVLQKLDRLDEAIKNLQYESKRFSRKNMKEIQGVVNYLQNRLFEHVTLDEEVVFPFLERHIPRLEPLLCFLRAERGEFKLSLENFEMLFQKLKDEQNVLRQYKIFEQLKEKGIYVTHLVRHHIQIEMESVYNMVDRQLHEDEKNELVRQCISFQIDGRKKKWGTHLKPTAISGN
ncbi:MAG: hemerythrin domain-containing protein [Candidatus Omnitrophica bacterium]|nr:hemerythrin domain-containing protein [Candidatus Omnitrophota bacterium]